MAKSLREQIQVQQIKVWDLAERCSTDHMSLKDQIFERGLVYMETEIMKKMFDQENDEVLKDYSNLLAEMRKFYGKVVKSQQGIAS